MSKRILITGASRGIGKALAFRYARENAELALLARNIEELELNTEIIEKIGGKAYCIQCDVSNLDNMHYAVEVSWQKMKGIDVAILNAGLSIHNDFNNFNTDDMKKVFEINVFGLAYGLEALIPIMKKQGSGIIAGVGSLAEARGFPGSGIYAASKAAAAHILEAARIELKGTGISIITIKPGFVRTDMIAINKFYMPFLMDADKAADIIFNGIRAGKERISFPWVLSMFSSFSKIIPGNILEPALRFWKKKFVKN